MSRRPNMALPKSEHVRVLRGISAPRGRRPRVMRLSGAASGLSLVELMVALALGLMLTAGILQVFSSSQQSYRLADAQVRVHENGRFAIDSIVSATRGARSLGCRSLLYYEQRDLEKLCVQASALQLPGSETTTVCPQGVIGTEIPLGYSNSEQDETGWLAYLPDKAQTAVGNAWLRGDVLVTWGSSGSGVLMAPGASVGSDGEGDLPLAANGKAFGMSSGGLALVTDCDKTDIFAITNGDKDDLTTLAHDTTFVVSGAEDETGEAANEAAQLSKAYGYTVPQAEGEGREYRANEYRPRVFPFGYNVHYICCMDLRSGEIQDGTSRNNCATQPDRYRPSLCLWSVGAGNAQLVHDIADMRVIYDGSDPATDSPLPRFTELSSDPDAAWVSAQGWWRGAESARIRLLVTGGDEVLSVADAFAGDEATVEDLGYGLATDRRLYHTVDVTVALRASAPWSVPEEEE